MFVSSAIIYPRNVDSLDHSKLYPFIVDSIKITGNEITEEFIILRELTFNVGDTLTQSLSFYNRERVYSLGIFNQVHFNPSRIDSINILNIAVEESWYIYPIPYLELKGDNSDRLSYGVYLRLKNFRGRNEDLTALIAFGYDPSFYLSYYNPNIIGTENIFFGSTVGYSDISNKSQTAANLYGQNFSQKYINIHLLAGKRFDLFNRLYVSGGFSYIETPFFIPGISASNDRIDNLVDIGIGYIHDTRDLSQFPKDGIYSSLNYTLKGFGIDDINYSVASFDFREYRKVFGELITKWRFTSRFTFGDKIPYYDYSILGANEKVRGHYSKKFEGNDYYLGSLEFYYPIIEEWNIDLTFIPIIPDQLLSYRVGFYTQIFAETGLAKLKGEPLALNRLNSGYGFGITCLILPYQILRVEVAFNENMNSQIILNLGISF